MSENQIETGIIEDIEVESKIDDGSNTGNCAKVIVYNDELHTFQQVINQLIKATGCSSEQAVEMTMMIHHGGQAEVYKGDMLECIKVSDVIQEIDLKTQVIY